MSGDNWPPAPKHCPMCGAALIVEVFVPKKACWDDQAGGLATGWAIHCGRCQWDCTVMDAERMKP